MGIRSGHEAAREIVTGLRDSLIVQAAVDGGASTLFSEDLAHGRSIRGVTIENHFC